MTDKREILVVDDDTDIRDAIRIILEKNGYQVRTGKNGREALEALKAKKPDLMILDIMMSTDTEGFDLAYALTGRFSGGPAKTSVIASGFMGSVSGSAVGNVVATGSFTIPMMKKVGYRPHVAGAIEAAASTGGQLMPPIMGAGAFLMAEFTQTSYL
ncbi:MAG: TRAP transporter large permease subunit, partial [Desulfobacterales bacterium]|nr:TRAP transporter large permease subunit [Desulfobacterales bacterium]